MAHAGRRPFASRSYRRPRRPVLSILAAALVCFSFAASHGRVAYAAEQPGSHVVYGAAQDESSAVRVYRMTGSRVAIGRSVVVERDEEVRDAVVVIGGSARIDGRVRDGVFAMGGDVELGPDADVRGDIVLVGGSLIRTPGARLSGAVSNVNIGDWRPRFWGARWSFGDVDGRAFWSWLGLAAATARVAILAVLMVFVLIVARPRVARVGRAAAAEPGRALLVGLAAEVLFLPLLGIFSVALALTIIGIPIAVVMTYSRVANQMFYPLLVASQSIPKVAIAPLFVVWFGFGILPKVICAFLLGFFPVVVSAVQGFKSVDPDMVDLARAMQGSRTNVFLAINLPHAMPAIFSSSPAISKRRSIRSPRRYPTSTPPACFRSFAAGITVSASPMFGASLPISTVMSASSISTGISTSRSGISTSGCTPRPGSTRRTLRTCRR